MGVEAIILATYEAEKKRIAASGKPIKIHTRSSETTEDKVKDLFGDLELPYDMTGVEILREYLMSLGKEDELAR